MIPKVLPGLVVFCFLLASCDRPAAPEPPLPTRKDSLAIFQKAFNPPESCQKCHPTHYREWEMSMHAYAIEDPVFHTMNKLGLEQTNGLLGEFCVQCHAPIATQLGEAPGGVLSSNLSHSGRRGVTCEVCHKSEAQVPGAVISKFRLDGIMYGPIKDPVPNSFHSSEYHPEIERSSNCSGCHDVINSRQVKVEATFSEWKNSIYPGRLIDCQVCHMKSAPGPAAAGGPTRQVHNHIMEGVDVPLTDFPGREEMIERVAEILRNSARTEFLPPLSHKRTADLPLVFEISNSITGHNLPSGTIFERQMWVEILVVNEMGDTLLHSGGLDPNGDLLNDKSEYVKQKLMAPDSLLVLFNGTAYRKGVEIPFFFDADAVLNRSIPPFQARNARFLLKSSRLAGSKTLFARARLYMRAMPPYFMRMLGHADLVKKVPIFTMEEKSAEIVLE